MDYEPPVGMRHARRAQGYGVVAWRYPLTRAHAVGIGTPRFSEAALMDRWPSG